jgi:hypothetical protein
MLTAGRFPSDPSGLAGGVLLLETSEELIPAREFGWIVRPLGERGLLAAVDAVLVARPPTSSFEVRPSGVGGAPPDSRGRPCGLERSTIGALSQAVSTPVLVTVPAAETVAVVATTWRRRASSARPGAVAG